MAVIIPSKVILQALVPTLKLRKQLGAGGNAVVYEAKSKDERLAVKFLVNTDPKRFKRFRDEVLVVTNTLRESRHVIPILEHRFPDLLGTEVPWYTMPVATPLRKHLEGKSRAVVLSALIELAEGLAELHAKNVAHRDIKPENLFYFDGALRYGDFGIAKFPESSSLTTTTEPIGPIGYMADEMIRDAMGVDPYKADVFSFAKTVWVMLTNQQHPFLGQYSRNGQYALDKLLAEGDVIYEPLDALLEGSTQNIPGNRPAAREFAAALRKAQDALSDFSLRNSMQWVGAEVSALSVPCARVEWTSPAEIVEVLNILSRRQGLNHCFFPDGGGWHVTGAELTEGGEAITLWHDQYLATVVRPSRLTLERLAAGPEGSYAALESDLLAPLGASRRNTWCERLLKFDGYDYMDLPGEDESLPDAVSVSRYFKPSMFIIAPTSGIYNQVDSYEGEGNALGRDKLREVFEGALRKLTRERSPFALRRFVRLLKAPTSADKPFILKLNLSEFENLLAFDDAMKSLRPKNRRLDLKAILNPDPVWLNKRDEITQFLSVLNDGQFAEARALMDFGLGSIFEASEIHEVSAEYLKEKRDTGYVVDRFGSDLLRRAAERFGLELIGEQRKG